jgi:hypothetical protein
MTDEMLLNQPANCFRRLGKMTFPADGSDASTEVSYTQKKSRDSSVGIVLGYSLDDRSSRVRFPTGAGNFSFHHRVQNGSGSHPASYPMCTRGSFPGTKAAGA